MESVEEAKERFPKDIPEIMVQEEGRIIKAIGPDLGDVEFQENMHHFPPYVTMAKQAFPFPMMKSGYANLDDFLDLTDLSVPWYSSPENILFGELDSTKNLQFANPLFSEESQQARLQLLDLLEHHLEKGYPYEERFLTAGSEDQREDLLGEDPSHCCCEEFDDGVMKSEL